MKRRPGTLVRISRLRAELASLVEELLEEPVAAQVRWQPHLDLVDLPDRLEARVELPGVAAADVRVEVAGTTLVIRGHKRRAASEPTARRFHLMERYIGPFELVVDLPQGVLPTRSSARLANGLLVVSLVKVVDQRCRAYPLAVTEEGPDHG